MKRIIICSAIVLSLSLGGLLAQEENAEDSSTILKKTIEDAIGWAVTKDLDLLKSIIANDPDLFMFNPDSSTVVGWDQFTKLFDFWMDPRFKATHFELKDLRINISRSGDVAWYSTFLDDMGEWDGRPIGWQDVRWTGVLEKRDGKWVHVQMHFSFPMDRPSETDDKEAEAQ